MLRGAGLAAAAAALACDRVSEQFWSLPELGPAMSYLVAAERAEGWQVIAGDRDAALWLLHPPESGPVYLLAYDATLAELNVPAGEIEPAALAARDDCALAHPAAAFSRFRDAPPEEGWVRSQMPASARTVLAPSRECQACAAFEESRDVLVEKVLSATWLESGAALLVLGDHSLLRATPGEATPIAPCGQDAFSIQSVGGNDVWLAARAGVGRARIDEASLRCIDGDWFPQPPGRGRVAALGATSGTGPAWVLTSSGSVQRVEGGQLIEVGTIDMRRARQPDYLVVPHGDGVLVSISSLAVHRFEHGRFYTDEIAPTTPTTTEVTALASVPPRALFGTNSGYLFARERGAWDIVYALPNDGDIQAVAPFRGGALLATEIGLIELPAQDPACPPIELSSRHGTERAMIARDDLVLLPLFAGPDPVTDHRPIIWLRRR
ncbi:MAG: hypothetical protein IT384_25210 [Deltaproteobacteria bacterium]|nr:hypothetical protein [Deltaproteobacteria bacterium]